MLKQAIDFVNNIPNNGILFDPLPLENRKNQVVKLLQYGNEYKDMWEELYEIASEFNFFPLMEKIKQKHFPE